MINIIICDSDYVKVRPCETAHCPPHLLLCPNGVDTALSVQDAIVSRCDYNSMLQRKRKVSHPFRLFSGLSLTYITEAFVSLYIQKRKMRKKEENLE